MKITQFLLEEHTGLREKIDELRNVADSLDLASSENIDAELWESFAFLADYLGAHAQAEEQVLYPAVAELLGSPRATETMSRDHKEIACLAERLDAFRLDLPFSGKVLPGQKTELRRLLYGLYAIINLHIAKEEELYFPLIDEYLDQLKAQDLLDAMARVTTARRIESMERTGLVN